MYLSEQYTMYNIAHFLLTKEKYDLIHYNKRNNEIWLAKTKWKQTYVIRLLHRSFDWKNHLKQDIAALFQRIKAVRSHFQRKKIHIFNVYVSNLEPVDHWVQLKKPMELKERNPLKMKVFYITEENKNEEISRFFTNIQSTNPYQVTITEDIEEQEQVIETIKRDFQLYLYNKNKQMREVFSFGRPIFTYLLIYLNLIIFFLLEVNGGSTNIDTLIEYGAKYNPAMIEGEWWRVVSSMFLHIGFLHLLMNMIALYYLGSAVERIFGSKRFLFIYFLAGIGGGLTSFATNINIAAGASGAIFGLFGALLFFGTIYKRLFRQTMGPNLIFILIINLILGFSVPQIDMGAHLGGLIAGYIASAICFVPKKQNVILQLFGGFIYIIGCILLTYYGISTTIDLLN